MVAKNKGYQREVKKKGGKEGKRVKLGSGNKNPDEQFLRRNDQKCTVSDLVYKYLKKIAYVETVRRQRNAACSKFRKRNARNRSIHPTRKYSHADFKKMKSYVRDAVSFAVKSGYLLPDKNGKIFRLSSRLKLNPNVE